MTETAGWKPTWAVSPGEILVEALEERGMSQADLGRRMARPTKTISEIATGRAAISRCSWPIRFMVADHQLCAKLNARRSLAPVEALQVDQLDVGPGRRLVPEIPVEAGAGQQQELRALDVDFLAKDRPAPFKLAQVGDRSSRAATLGFSDGQDLKSRRAWIATDGHDVDLDPTPGSGVVDLREPHGRWPSTKGLG